VPLLPLLLLPAQERRAARSNGAAAVPEDTTRRRTIFQPRASDLHAARAMRTREWTGLCGNGAAVQVGRGCSAVPGASCVKYVVQWRTARRDVLVLTLLGLST
jgi:hypothetical protein